MLSKIIIKVIRIYQNTLSLDHGLFKDRYPVGYCKFHPSCSEYSILAIEKYGLTRGCVKSIIRIFKCNPWSKGGFDKP